MRVLRRRRPAKERYEESVLAIKKAILSEDYPKEAEIDISRHYSLSALTLGEEYVTLDWPHKEDIRKIIKTINNYYEDPSLKRPLNIFMSAEPGSGKSHFVKCLAQKFSGMNVSAVTYNMGTLQNVDDLMQPLEVVRNLKVQDRLPILFLDEFDSAPSNYSFLLSLLWDGELHIGHSDLKLGKIVIILAGSDPTIIDVMKAVRTMRKESYNDKLLQDKGKLVDLLSRINGGTIEIPDLDILSKLRDRRVDKICLCISLLRRRFTNLQLVPWALLRFIGLNKFRYGVRSIAHIIDLIPWNDEIKDRLLLENLQLPFNSEKELRYSSLAYHLTVSEEAREIIEMWQEIASCTCLIRFEEEEKEEHLE